MSQAESSTYERFPFSLRHFFKGGLCREEVVSACLAMLLEGSTDVRRHFFMLCGDQRLTESANANWTVAVEHDELDIRLECDDTIVIIENKVFGASKQSGQLLRYYLRQKRAWPDSRVVAVMLAPRRVGMDEVERTQAADEFTCSTGDHACHVSWTDLLSLPSTFGELHREWIIDLFQLIAETIQQGTEEKYPAIGDRGTVRDLVRAVHGRIKEVTALSTSSWSGAISEEVYSTKSIFTISVGIRFESGSEPPFLVTGLVNEDGSLLVTLRSYFNLAKKHTRNNKSMVTRWQDFATRSAVAVPGVGDYLRQLDSSYLLHKQLRGTREEVIAALVSIWSALEQFVKKNLMDSSVPPDQATR